MSLCGGLECCIVAVTALAGVLAVGIYLSLCCGRGDLGCICRGEYDSCGGHCCNSSDTCDDGLYCSVRYPAVRVRRPAIPGTARLSFRESFSSASYTSVRLSVTDILSSFSGHIFMVSISCIPVCASIPLSLSAPYIISDVGGKSIRGGGV